MHSSTPAPLNQLSLRHLNHVFFCPTYQKTPPSVYTPLAKWQTSTRRQEIPHLRRLSAFAPIVMLMYRSEQTVNRQDLRRRFSAVHRVHTPTGPQLGRLCQNRNVLPPPPQHKGRTWVREPLNAIALACL